MLLFFDAPGIPTLCVSTGSFSPLSVLLLDVVHVPECIPLAQYTSVSPRPTGFEWFFTRRFRRENAYLQVVNKVVVNDICAPHIAHYLIKVAEKHKTKTIRGSSKKRLSLTNSGWHAYYSVRYSCLS